LIPGVFLLLSKLARAEGKPHLRIFSRVFSRDIVLGCLAASVLVIAYFAISKSILAIEFSPNLFERFP
jgi:hypothetical protein